MMKAISGPQRPTEPIVSLVMMKAISGHQRPTEPIVSLVMMKAISGHQPQGPPEGTRGTRRMWHASSALT